MSRSLSEVDVPNALSERVRLTGSAPMEIMAELNKESWNRVNVDGGKVIQLFLVEGLTDDILLTTHLDNSDWNLICVSVMH